MYVEVKHFENYFELDTEQLDFIQRLVFLDYVELIEQNTFKKRLPTSIITAMTLDLIEHEEQENYETCRLLYDIINRIDDTIDYIK